MNAWRIRAHGAFEAVAEEPPSSLHAPLRECLPRPPRRINRYIRLALIGAHRCVGRLGHPLPSETPLYMASEQGSVAEAVTLMDEIVLHGRSPMPMSFVNVSSNMVGYYLAASLGLAGRNVNVARSHDAFGAMLDLAALEMELATDRQGMILLGSVGECVWPLAEHRQRCELPADTPLVESSYWMAVDRHVDDVSPKLTHRTTRDEVEAQSWLAAGGRWVIDPHWPVGYRQRWISGLDSSRAWRGPLCHRGHPDAIVHALFGALQTRPTPDLRVVSGGSSQGYQLIGVC